MKIQLLVIALLFSTFSCFVSAQTKINGITFPDTYSAGKEKLVLNGGGVREKYWMDLYVGALYLPTKNKDAASVISDNSSMVIRICIISNMITSEKMSNAVDEGFKKSTGGKEAQYKDEIAKFQKAFSEQIKMGDVFDIVYTPESITIYKNGVSKGDVKGLDFKKAVFGIWLGNAPADEDLKEGMLGEAD